MILCYIDIYRGKADGKAGDGVIAPVKWRLQLTVCAIKASVGFQDKRALYITHPS